MYMVVFKAKVKTIDNEYVSLVSNLRELAFTKYNCVDFISTGDDALEITISYWKSMNDILNWKKDIYHLEAQKKGREKWYENYQIEIAEINRSYNFNV